MLIDALHIDFCKKVFSRVKEREGSLSAMEVFSLEVIRSLNNPTIGEFASFTGISQSNATYKVNSLVSKGYLTRVVSREDGREFNLHLSDKYFNYKDIFRDDVIRFTLGAVDSLTDEEKAVLEKALIKIDGKLEAIKPANISKK